MRISLNLATRPFTDLGPAVRRLRIAMGVLAALCILFGFGLHFFDNRAAAARAREHEVDGQIAQIQAERQRAENIMRLPANAGVLNQAQALNQIFDDKGFSWTLAMEAMETVLPPGVQVLAIEPVREKDGHITVHMRVAGPHDRAVELVRNLEHSRRFLLPRIVNESAETSNAPNQRPAPDSPSSRFDFDLFADYNPPSHEERIAIHSTSKLRASPVPLGIRPPHPTGAAPAAAMQHAGRPPYTGPAPQQPGTNPPYFHNPSPAPTHAPGGPQ
jgi:type IV pilus assembly protein PilN